MKERVPWPLKIVAKLTLARLPIPYRVWTRLGIFRHGAMDEPQYAIGVVRNHLRRTGVASPFTALELGPGDSVASAVVAYALGATGSYLVDVGRYAQAPLEAYAPLVDALRAEGLRVPELEQIASVDDLCAAVNGHYLTDGLSSLRTIETASIDVVWSQAVLEHVRRDQFDEIQRELRRVLRPEGVATHRIDLQDHLALSLNNLRFSDGLWERPLVWNSGFYTNRLRAGEILASIRGAGFRVDVEELDRWPHLPLDRSKMAARFRTVDVDELRVRSVDVVARPA